jgi:hypothetical protein
MPKAQACRYLPIQTPDPLASEFECYLPDPAWAAKEVAGQSSTHHADSLVPMIEAPEALPFVDLPARFLQILKDCWQSAKASPGAQRSGLQIGGARQQAFNALGPAAQGHLNQAGKHFPQVRPSPVPDALKQVPPHLEGLARDWNLQIMMDRVNAFTFRGETSFRTPVGVSQVGGFSPPITRDDDSYIKGDVYKAFSNYMLRRFQEDITLTVDPQAFLTAFRRHAVDPASRKLMTQFAIWKAIMEQESSHLGRMTANETLKGFISTTREISIAKSFAKTNGWVYLVLVRGGYVVPLKDDHIWAGLFNEQEIALLGSIPWKEVFAFRKTSPTEKKFVGPIYFRKGFGDTYPTPFQMAYELFSGRPQ